MRIVFTLIAALLCTVATAAPKLISGSLDFLAKERYVLVVLDCSETTFKMGGRERPFDVFLKKAPRDVNWEYKSVSYFIRNFNERIWPVELQGVSSSSNIDCRYTFVIKPKTISKSGTISAYIYVDDIETEETKAVISFSAEGDDDDSIALRDPMKEAGEEMGKFLKSKLKKIKKR